MIRRAQVLALLLLPLVGGVAQADPIPLVEYERVLADARAQADIARGAQGEVRQLAVRRALTLLSGATEVRVGTAVYTAVPHATVRALLETGDDANLASASAMLDETLAAVRRAEALGGGDPAPARAFLDGVLRSPDFRRVPDWRDALTAFLRDLVADLFPDLRAPRVTQEQLTVLIGAAAVALLAFVASSSLRGARAKVTREALLARGSSPRGPSAADHLRAADEARRAGRLRDALRELFLGALLALERRGGVRVDPALTDREILARAAHLARAGDLEALVALYERAWYGLHEPSDVDVERASELARRIAA